MALLIICCIALEKAFYLPVEGINYLIASKIYYKQKGSISVGCCCCSPRPHFFKVVLLLFFFVVYVLIGVPFTFKFNLLNSCLV